MKKIILMTIITGFSTVIWADGSWDCINSIAEVSCLQLGTCKALYPAQSFNISIKNNNQVSVCAQNKCWRGFAQPATSGSNTLYPMRQFNWTTLDQPNGEYTLAVNQYNKSVSLQNQGKSLPLQCIPV